MSIGNYMFQMFNRLLYVTIFLIVLSGMFAGGYNALKNQVDIKGVPLYHFSGLNPKSTILDCFYFSLCNTTGISYGEIIPRSDIAKIAVSSQRLISVAIILTFFVPFKSSMVLKGSTTAPTTVPTTATTAPTTNVVSSNLMGHSHGMTNTGTIGHSFVENTLAGPIIKTILPPNTINR